MSYYRQQLEAFLKTLDIVGNTVYDIGGGQGDVRPRLHSYMIADYQCLDLPDYDLDYLGEGDSIGDFWTLPKADVIFCLEVFEYLIRPVEALDKIEYLLKEGGKAYVTFAFAYPHHNELELDALRYTEPGIHRLAKEAGLTITNTWYRVDKSGLLQSFYSSDGMHPAKEYAHHDVTGFIIEFTK